VRLRGTENRHKASYPSKTLWMVAGCTLKVLATVLRLPVSDEFPGQFLAVWSHFLWPSEGDAARFGGQSAVACSGYDEGAFELAGMRCTAYR
jgi:hypothetical protein